MNPLIHRLDQWFKTHRPKHYRHLLPGTTAAKIAAFEKRQKVVLPAIARDFFQWRNGENMDKIEGRFQNNWSLMTLEEVEATCDTMRELLEAGDFEKKDWWRPGWIPFLANGGGDHLCVDLTGAFKGVPGQVIEFFHDDENREIRYPGMEKWLEFFVVTLEQGLWTYDPEGEYFEMKDAAFKSSMKKLCPGYPIPRKAR